MSVRSWLIVHRPGFEFFLLPILALAVVLVWLERSNRRGAISWVLVGSWIALWAGTLPMMGILRHRSNLPALLMWLLVGGVSTLIPLPLAQVGNLAARRARSPIVHGAGIFAAGWVLGVPLLMVVADLLVRTLRPFTGTQ